MAWESPVYEFLVVCVQVFIRDKAHEQPSEQKSRTEKLDGAVKADKNQMGDSFSPPVSERENLTNVFLALPEDEQIVHAHAARERLRARRLLTPTLNRKIESGKWKYGVVLDEILRNYKPDKTANKV